MGGGMLNDHQTLQMHILHSPIQWVKSRLQHAWEARIGGIMSTRNGFAGLQNVDAAGNRACEKQFNTEQLGFRRTGMNGTFFTNDTLIHSGKITSKICKYCDAEDSIAHRTWDCPFFQDARAHVTDDMKQTIQSQPDCLRLHGWGLESPWRKVFISHLNALPDQTGEFCPCPLEDAIHAFTDGSCTDPAEPVRRLASWGVVVASLATWEFFPIAAGRVPGGFQTVLRAEISAAISACRFGLQCRKPTTIWTDNEQVFNKLRRMISGGCNIHERTDTDHDLWLRLQECVAQFHQHGISLYTYKVRAHENEACYSDVVERWVIEGNAAADRAAAEARNNLPTPLLQAWKNFLQDHARRRLIMDTVQRVIVNIGTKAVANKTQITAPAVTTRDADDTLFSFDDVAGIDHGALTTECERRVSHWMQSILAEGSEDTWITSYQLLVHFQLATGCAGLSRNQAKQWDLDADDGGFTFDFLGYASRLQLFLKEFCKKHHLSYATAYRPPSGGIFFNWQRVIRLKVKRGEFDGTNAYLRQAVGGQIRRIRSQLRDVPVARSG